LRDDSYGLAARRLDGVNIPNPNHYGAQAPPADRYYQRQPQRQVDFIAFPTGALTR
jgi:hypothetical protein